MDTRELNTRSVNITQLKKGGAYFTVGVQRNMKIFLDQPFRFVEIVNKLDERGVPEKMIMQERLDVFALPMTFPRSHAETLGLLVGTEYPSRFGDNYWRTFEYSPEAYQVFKKIALEQDMTRYESIVGKREPLSVAQRVQGVLLDAIGEVAHQMIRRYRGASTF